MVEIRVSAKCKPYGRGTCQSHYCKIGSIFSLFKGSNMFLENPLIAITAENKLHLEVQELCVRWFVAS